MQVLRIETEAGDGPYRGSLNAYETAAQGFDPARHPCPSEDGGMRRAWRELGIKQGLYSFGFKDEEQMLAWFYIDEVRQALDRLGYYVAVYEVPEEHVIVGYTQAVFNKDHAELVRRDILG